MNGEQMGAGRIHASHDKICTDVTLITEEVLFEHRHARHDARFPAGREGMELEVGGYYGSDELCICSGTGTRTPNLRRNVMEFLAVLDFHAQSVHSFQALGNPIDLTTGGGAKERARRYLVCHDGSAGCSRICRDDNSAIIKTSYNGGTGACSLG